MAVNTSQTVVGVTPSKLVDGSGQPGREENTSKVWLRLAAAATASVFVGGPNLAAGNGFELAAGQTVGPLQLGAGESLYGIVVSGTHTVSWIQSRV